MKDRRNYFWMAAGSLLLIVVGILIGRGGEQNLHVGHQHESGEAETPSAGETIWTCSMHPQVRLPGPGQCPVCGMDLIPVSAGPDGDLSGDLPQLSIGERAAALMNVQTWPVDRRELRREISLPGRIAYDERKLGVISAWIPGRLEKLHVNFTGTRVERGEPMAVIYSPALISAQEEFVQALRARERFAESGMVSAARERLLLLGLTEEQVASIEERGEVLDRLTISAPMTGVVVERFATEGMYVETGEPIYAVADMSELWVNLEAYESDLAWLRVGQRVIFTTAARPGEVVEGTVAFINPVVDEQSRTVGVRANLSKPEDWMKPGMLVRGEVQSSVGTDPEELPLAIPASAPLITGERAVVYVKLPDTEPPTFEAREVLLGPKAGRFYVVREGLDEGEIVVKRGSFRIDSELQIRGLGGMMAPRETRTEVETATIPAEFGQQVNRVVEAYLNLTAALAADDSAAAGVAVEEMHSRIQKTNTEMLDEEEHRAWEAVAIELGTVLEGMFQAGTLESYREALPELTEVVQTAIGGFHAGQIQSVYRARCPMAFGDLGGTWLQRSDVIANPYFGAAMHQCGDILERFPSYPASESTADEE